MSAEQSNIESLLSTVNWRPVEADNKSSNSDLPYATHEGVLEISGHKLKCFRLNTGEAVFDANSVEAFFAGMGS